MRLSFHLFAPRSAVMMTVTASGSLDSGMSRMYSRHRIGALPHCMLTESLLRGGFYQGWDGHAYRNFISEDTER